MKVLFSTYTTAFQNPGGGENVIFQLKRNLIESGHQVELFNPVKHSPSDFDIIHHFSAVESERWAYFSKFKKPLVVTPTVYLDESIVSTLKWKIHMWGAKLEQFSLGNCVDPYSKVNLWLAATKLEADALEKFYSIPPEEIFILPNGVDLGFSKCTPELFRTKSGITDSFVLHVGRFHPVKNQNLLIRACANLNTPAVFIGGVDEDYREYRQSCIELAIQLEAKSGKKLFHFFDREPFGSEFLGSAYAAAAVFALPSDFESFGISALEAMVAGVPCVLSSNMADKSVFPGARFVDPHSESAWSEEIRDSLKNSKSPAKSEIEEVLNRYSWARITKSLLAKYGGLISGTKNNS